MKNGSGEKRRKAMADAFRRGLRQLYGTDENQGAGETLRAGRKKKVVRAASVLACIVAFTTTYALILPAVTLESQPVCGQEEHIHTDACYAYLDADGATVDPAVAVSLPVAGDSSTDAENAQMTLLSGSRGGYYESNESNAITETAGISDDGRTESQIGDGSADMTGESGAESADGTVSDLAAAVDTDSNPAAPLTDDISTEVTSAENTGSDGHSVTALSADPADDADTDASGSDHPDTTDIPMPDVTADAPETATDSPVADAPQAVRRVLICGQEEHQHSVECYPAKSDASTKKISPKSILTGLFGDDHSQSVTVDGTTITAEYKEGVLPDGVMMQAVPVPADAYVGAVADAVGKENTEIKSFDITFLSDGQEIEPSGEVKITFQADFITPDTDPAIVHITDDGSADLMDTKIADDTITLKTDSFSVYAISYTVDFHWEVDGKTYDFSMPGGGFVSFTDLVEVLGIAGDGSNQENQSENTESGSESGVQLEGEVSSVDNQDATALTLDGIEISEETRKFVEGVEKVEFSSPDLVWIGKTDSETTVGKIKDAQKLEVEYSAELTEAQIDQINGTSVSAGDWALISLKAFDTEENLTVTLKDGEVFTVRVTDAQIVKDYISASGETYTITVIYDGEAGIPDGADFKVREIEAGTEEYQKYLNDSAEELGLENADEVSFARFFDIEIVDKDGKKVEPKAAVQVKIAYKEAVEADAFTNIVHFAEDGTEIISDLALSEDGKTITYEQDSFSVTGTIQTGNPTNGGIYMVLVEYNGKHYMVNNDGTLSEIDYGKDASGTTDDTKVAVEYPMFWTYYYDRGGHLRFASEASGFNADQTASGYYYKYIDPNSTDGIIEEHKNGNADNLLSNTVITYHDNSISNASYNKYIGVVNDGGVLRISGNVDASNAAQIELATPSNVLPSDPLKHSVNHIDIGFDASATVTVPVAYGEYTLRDANGTVIRNITVNQQNTLDVTVEAGKGKENEIIILPDDMKAAEIKAYKQSDYNLYKNNPEELANHELNDAFYITGYSQNDTTDYSEMQVRVEGSFKVATGIPDANWNYYSWWNQTYINQVKQQRLNNQVEYVVTLNKTVEIPLTIDGYCLYDQDGVPMSVTVDIPLKDSFTYWDTRNECPPVQWDKTNWQSGDIATHGMSGMDFRLDGGNVEVRADIVALNITKYIEDMNGTPIKVGSEVTNSFEVYRDTDGDPDTVKTLGEENVDYNEYAFLHSRDVKIAADSDQNIVHDYQVTPGMYYVRESPQSVKDNATITDTTGQQWTYKATEIQTEWVWREGEWNTQDDKGRLTKVHTSDTYTGKDSDTYNAIPDVLGRYKNNAGGDEFNGFLEFYVINKYEKVQGEIPEPSQDSMNIQLEKKWDDNGDTSEPDGNANVPFTLHQVKKTTVEGAGSGQTTGIKVVLYDIDGHSELASTYANISDTIHLDFSTNGTWKKANIQIKNIYSYDNGVATWRDLGMSYGNNTNNYIQSNGSGGIDTTIYYTVDNRDVVDGLISLRLNPDQEHTISGDFTNKPAWVGAAGSGGGSSFQTTTAVDPDGSGYPKKITLSNTTGWSYLFQNLPTKETIPAEKKTIEYSYYLEEGTPTGSAADFTSPEYRVYLDEDYTRQDEKDASDKSNAITGSGITKYVEVTNKKATLTVKKEWLGEEETDAYPPIRFKLYQGVKSGNGVNAGQEYTADTNVPKENGYYTISAKNNWQVEFNNLPLTREDNGNTVDIGYYVQEFDPGDNTNWFGKVTVSYAGSTGNSGTSPQNGGIAGNNGTLTIINKLPTYAQITIIKKWFENNNGSWNDVSGDVSKTSGYAFGFIVQRKVEVLNANDQKTGEVFDFEDYGSEIVVSQNKVLVNDNEFNVKSQGSIWQYRIQGSGDINRHENDLVKTGYYEKADGSKVWAEFSYRFMETNAYDLNTVIDGETVKNRSKWKTLPWNPKYENSGNQTTISNYPIGEIDVTKNWENEDPDLEIGSKVYFKVYRDGVDITSDIVQNPANYGLYSNQVYTDGDPAHNSIVLIYDGTEWETIRVQGLPILTENSSQYQYKIQEIGYSDRNSIDFWDVSTFLQGYKVDGGQLAAPDNQGQSQAVNSAAPFNTITIENKYIKTETEYEFTKVWQNSAGEGTSWQAPITVTLYQTKGDVAAGTDTPTDKTAHFTIDPYGVIAEGEHAGDPTSRTFTFDGKSYEWSMEVSHNGSYYTFIIEHLPYKDGDDILSYYITEDSLGGYLTSYAFKVNDDDPDLTIKTSATNREKNDRALDEQYIINKQPGVELPSTGGSGTMLFSILGSILVIFSGTGLILWKKRRFIGIR